MASVSPPSDAAEMVAVRWIDAYNARDLGGMLACLHPDVEYHPLRLGGLTGVYRGRDGVRRWFADLDWSRDSHAIDLLDVREVGADHVIADGAVRIAGDAHLAPFSALYRTENGVITDARHYLSDADLLEQLERPR